MDENEISSNANGGTELTKRLVGQYIPEDLANEFQIVPSRVRELKEDKIRIYWAHDLPDDPECSKFTNENFRNKFHKMVFVSHWQMQQFIDKLKIPYTDKLQVIENPIKTLDRAEKPTDVINLVYFSTPQRGLNVLVPVFEALSEKHKNIHLHVFSSFKIYGWDEADAQWEPLYDKIRNHPQMTYHGYVKQEELTTHLQNMHILAYPSTWPETSCRVLIESMSAGLFCVHSNLAALPETSGGITFMYQYSQDMKEHADTFYKYLDRAIENYGVENMSGYLKLVKTYADTRYDIDALSKQWLSLLQELREKYPTVESRKFPEQMFVYKTT
jgi:glycosyltransferase involved in cell wall biosynthesis